MKHRSKFLVIVDDSKELNVAIRFAAKRAQSTKGGVILLNVIEQFDPQQWQSIEDIILQEAREKAQEKLQKWSKVINDLTNVVPELMVKEGVTSEKIIETPAKVKATGKPKSKKIQTKAKSIRGRKSIMFECQFNQF